MAQTPETARWKMGAGAVCAILIGIMFLATGLYKMIRPHDFAALLRQLLLPSALSVPGAVLLGFGETLTAIFLFMPRFRRWGAYLSGLMLVIFMVYIGINYSVLLGAECSCFPWIKRTIGPGFFVGDGIMLLLTFLGGWWARPSSGLKTAALICAAIAVCSGVAFGVDLSSQSGAMAPQQITVDGKPFSLHEGKVLLYFFDPECSHCDAAARRMAKHTWVDGVKIIGLASRVPKFAAYFMDSTKLNGKISPDHDLLKKAFPHGDPPFAVPLVNGRQKAALAIFDENEPEKALRQFGFIQ